METRSKLNVILAKYDLRDVLEAVNEHQKPVEPDHQKRLFKDKNLDRLWTKALDSKFSEEELKILKEEFQHYERKLEEYHELADKVHELEAKVKHEQERWENSVERLDENHEYGKPSSENHLQHLNDKHRAVKDSYFKLQDKVLGNEKIELDSSRLFEEDDGNRYFESKTDSDQPNGLIDSIGWPQTLIMNLISSQFQPKRSGKLHRTPTSRRPNWRS